MPARTRTGGQDERRRPREAVLDQIAKYVGPHGLRPVDFIETVWSAEEWTRGAYGTSYGVGGLTRFGEDLRRSIGPIHWACTDIAGVGHIHMEGVRSDRRAAKACTWWPPPRSAAFACRRDPCCKASPWSAPARRLPQHGPLTAPLGVRATTGIGDLHRRPARGCLSRPRNQEIPPDAETRWPT